MIIDYNRTRIDRIFDTLILDELGTVFLAANIQIIKITKSEKSTN